MRRSKLTPQHILKCHIAEKNLAYEIEIHSGMLRRCQSLLKFLSTLSHRCVAIAHESSLPSHAFHIVQQLKDSGIEIELLTFPPGEQHKTRMTKEKLENELLERSYGRDTCLIAIGGGVVTDMVGYVAATYCRGIPFIAIPTTLLGMVDASIGGKTGVNTPHGKNMVGCLYQPKKVFIDPEVLHTLPQQELKNGAVEMIKHAIIDSSANFLFLETHTKSLLARDLSLLEEAIAHSCRIKKTIVEQDEREQGKRHLLNFGHTIGHAIELQCNFSITHGEAVAIGILAESYLSLLLGFLTAKNFKKIWDLLICYELPLQLPAECSDLNMLLKTMERDKKSLQSQPRFVLIEDIGLPHKHQNAYCVQVPKDKLIETLEWTLQQFVHKK